MCTAIHDAGIPSALGISFNLFRLRGSDLFCAVPVDRPVPALLDARWAHVGEAGRGIAIPGFDVAAAARRVARHGFALLRAHG